MMQEHPRRAGIWVALATLSAAATAAPPPDHGFDFVTIGAVNNRAYEGGGFDGEAYRGRGSVSYEYRMARMEVSTGHWLEFLNTIAPLTDSPDTFGVATTWGGRSVGGTPPGDFELRPVANAAMIPVIGISWRSAAMYVNWLHNDKEVSLAAISNGAYDISTFGSDENNHFTDQPTPRRARDTGSLRSTNGSRRCTSIQTRRIRTTRGRAAGGSSPTGRTSR